MTPVQNSILNHLKTFLSYRVVWFSEEVLNLQGPFTKEHPETYALVKTGDVEVYIYEDGQSQVKKGTKTITSLEVEDVNFIQDLQAIFFEKMTELFGSYPVV